MRKIHSAAQRRRGRPAPRRGHGRPATYGRQNARHRGKLLPQAGRQHRGDRVGLGLHQAEEEVARRLGAAKRTASTTWASRVARASMLASPRAGTLRRCAAAPRRRATPCRGRAGRARPVRSRRSAPPRPSTCAGCRTGGCRPRRRRGVGPARRFGPAIVSAVDMTPSRYDTVGRWTTLAYLSTLRLTDHAWGSHGVRVFYEIPVARPWDPDSERQAYHDTLEQAVLADTLGWHSVWTVEHHFLQEYSHCSNPEVLYGVDRGPHREHPARLRRAARAEAVQPPRPLGGVGRGARPPQRRASRVRHRSVVDAHRARGLRRRPLRDRADVAGGAHAHRRLLDERGARVRRRVLVDAEASRAAEAAAGTAPADVGRDGQRGRPPHDGRARPGTAVVQRRHAAGGARPPARRVPRGDRELHGPDPRAGQRTAPRASRW